MSALPHPSPTAPTGSAPQLSPRARLGEWTLAHQGLADMVVALTYVLLVVTGILVIAVFTQWEAGDNLQAWVVAIIIMLLLTVVAVLLSRLARAGRERVTYLENRTRQLELERDQREQLAVADERARIAREMHDVVAHSLTVLVTMTEGALAVIDTKPDLARTALEQMGETGRQALTDTRRLVGVLRTEENHSPSSQTPPPSATAALAGGGEGSGEAARGWREGATVGRGDDPDVPLAPAPDASNVEELINQFRSTGLPVEYHYRGAPLPPKPALQMTVFRLIQEALTNVLQHAPGTPFIAVEVDRVPGGASLTVTNSASSQPDPGPGSRKGLMGMRERAAVYQGTIEAGPTPDGGWRLRATLYWDERTPKERSEQWMLPK